MNDEIIFIPPSPFQISKILTLNRIFLRHKMRIQWINEFFCALCSWIRTFLCSFCIILCEWASVILLLNRLSEEDFGYWNDELKELKHPPNLSALHLCSFIQFVSWSVTNKFHHKDKSQRLLFRWDFFMCSTEYKTEISMRDQDEISTFGCFVFVCRNINELAATAYISSFLFEISNRSNKIINKKSYVN